MSGHGTRLRENRETPRFLVSDCGLRRPRVLSVFEPFRTYPVGQRRHKRVSPLVNDGPNSYPRGSRIESGFNSLPHTTAQAGAPFT